MIYGWAGTILHIDLATGKIVKKPSDQYVKSFLGGRGVNVKLFYDLSKPGQLAFEPATPLIFGAGPLVGSGALCGAKMEITTRDPFGNLIGNTHMGGLFASEFKFAGYDNIVIVGRAKNPEYVYIDNDDVEIKSAEGIWGKGAFATQDLIREQLGDEEVQVVSIGQAGEKLVRAASIEHNYRGGMPVGAVMGAKKLKAIAVRGTKHIKVFDPESLFYLNEKLFAEIMKSREAALKQQLRGKYSQDRVFAHFDSTDRGVVGNFESHTWSELNKVRPDDFLKEHPPRMISCFGCPFPCIPFITVPDVGASAMYCYSFYHPWHIYLTDWKTQFEATRLCSDYGIDNKEVVATMAWLMHMYHDGIITAKDTDGIPMEKGSSEAYISTIHKIAKREGFGDILADGPLRFAEKIGDKAKEYLVHRRGVAPRAVESRAEPATALELAVGRQHRSSIYFPSPAWGKFVTLEEKTEEAKNKALTNFKAYIKKITGTEKAAIPWEYEGHGKLVVYAEHSHAIPDMLGICATARGEYLRDRAFDAFAAIFTAVTGVAMDEKLLFQIAERILNVERAFLVREGITRKDDLAPEKFFEEPISDGPQKGRILDRDKFEKMKSEYYYTRGWDVATGVPSRKRLEELGLKDIADSLEKHGKLPKSQKT